MTHLLYLFLFLSLKTTLSLHLSGTFNTNEFFKFITRFGIQSTDMHDITTRGYIYGNISIIDSTGLKLNKSQPLPNNLLIMLTVMDYNYFIDYYNHRRIMPKSIACPMMFEKIAKTAYFFECNENGKQDFIRRVPCQSDFCVDEDRKENVIPGYQFTFKIQDFNQPRFWYVSLAACVRDACEWTDLYTGLNKAFNLSTTSQPCSYKIAYDIWLVNGNPNSSTRKQFEYQFSYELHDIFTIYLCSFVIYLCILPLIVYRVRKHFHKLYLQLLIYVAIELSSRFFSLVHNLVFSINGHGVYFMQIVGDLFEAIANSILILILISIAKGWTIRSQVLKTTPRSIVLGFVLQFILVLSHMIALATIDPVFNNNPYETVSGYVEMGTRFLFMVWFLIELKETFNNLETAAFRNECASDDERPSSRNRNLPDQYENDSDIEIEPARIEPTNMIENSRQNQKFFSSNRSREKRSQTYRKFYLHYGACCLVWFIYLPILIFITSFVSELFRLRLVLSIRYFVNFISVVVLLYIMWSPKTPLKLPGKKPIVNYENLNFQNLLVKEANEDETDLDNDENILLQTY